MLKKFAVKNYKNFKEKIEINFDAVAGYQFSSDCICNGLISKMLIYGRNATGKTNLGRAVMNIHTTLFPINRIISNEDFRNADSKEDSTYFAYTFEFDGTELIYNYERFSSYELKTEELIIDGNLVFRCDFQEEHYSFNNLKYINAETAYYERYINSLDAETAEESLEPHMPFLRWLISNVAFGKDSILIQLANYVRRMTMITVGNDMPFRAQKMSRLFYEMLEENDGLNDLECFLNEMGIECKLVLKKLPDGQKELYFAHEKLVPFYGNASSGTLALVELYRKLVFNVYNSSFVYLDEFDAFYHYEMSDNVVRFFKKKYPDSQMIMTTHNTNLMTNRLMRPDCMFILSRKGTLTALCNATERELREGHNLEKMYISGEFEKYE